MKTGSVTSLLIAALFVLPACDSYNKLIGKDKNNNESQAAAPNQQQAPSLFTLYKDGAGAMNTDPESRMYGDGLDPFMSMELRSGPDASEGVDYVRIHTDIDGGAWIMTFDRNTTGRTQDLSGLTSIAFAIRLVRTDRPILPADQLWIDIEDGNGAVVSTTLQSVTGFDPNIFTWQQLSVPVPSSGVDLSKIRRPFSLRYGTLANHIHLDIDFDDVRWAP